MNHTAGHATFPPLVRSLLALLSGSLISQLLTSIAALLVARALGPTQFAPYAAALALATLTAPLVTFGMDGWLLQQGRYGSLELSRAIGGAFTFRLLAGALWLLLLPPAAATMRPTTYSLGLVVVLAGAVWLESLLALGLTALKAQFQNLSTSLVMALVAAVLLIATLVLASRAAPAASYAAARVGSALVGVLWAFWLVRARGVMLPTARESAGFISATVPFWLSELLFALYQRADATILAVRVGGNALALYAPAIAVIGALYLVPTTVYSVVVPRLARQIEAQIPRDELAAHVRRLFGGMAALGTLLFVVTALAARGVIDRLLGPAYAPTGSLLQILAGVLFFKSLSFGAAAILVAGGWQGRRTIVQGFVALFSIVTNWWLAPIFGVVGAAWLFVASDGLLALGYLWMAWGWWQRRWPTHVDSHDAHPTA